MGRAKPALEWHGSTLLYRTAALLGRTVGGPVVVVRAAGQALPALPPVVAVVEDPEPGRGPLQGIATGLLAVAARTSMAFVCATDLPFLHPAFVRRVLAEPDADVALPIARGHRQPLAAGYRTSLAGPISALLDAGERNPGALFATCRVTVLDEVTLRADPAIARLDPGLESLTNVNEPGEYARAREQAAPAVSVVRRVPPDGRHTVRAATLAAAAAAVRLPLNRPVVVVVNGASVSPDPQYPLVAGDIVEFSPAAPDEFPAPERSE